MAASSERESVLCRVEDGVAIVTISRPKALNALNSRTLDELEATVAELAAEAAVQAIVVTGDGEKAFVAGADIAELAELRPVDAQAASAKGQRVFSALENCGKPVVGAINGFALGGGLELALACHIRIASEKARMGLPEVTLGLIPGYGGTQRLARTVGVGRALQMVQTGDMIDAATAERWGLVTQVCPPADLLDTAVALARKIASRGPVAVRLATDAVLRGLGGSLQDGLNVERDLFGLVFATDDMREGTQAFLDKRKARFRGA